MSSTSVTSLQGRQASGTASSRSMAIMCMVLLSGAFVFVFWNFFRRMVLISTQSFTGINPDWGHIVAIPFISAFFIYIQREQLERTPSRLDWLGLILVLLGVFGFLLGIYPVQNDMAQGLGMVTALFGLAWFFFGASMMRYLWFPVLYMLFMIKISDTLWHHLAVILQNLAASLSTATLQFIASFSNFDVANRGSTIDLSFMSQGVWVTESLNVAEACAGLRMLMAFIALGVAVAFIWCRHTWQRLIMVGLTIPIAVAVNVGRVTILGLLYLYDRELAQGAFHTFVGMLMLIPGLLCFLGIGWILEHLFIEDEDAVSAKAAATERPVIERDWSWSQDWRRMALGAVWGAVLTVMMGLVWVFATASLRPDFLGFIESSAAYAAITVMLVVAIVVMAVAAQRLSQSIGSTAPSRERAFAFGLLLSMLIIIGIGQNSVIAATKYVLIRQPVPLVRPLFEVPAEVGDWKMVREHPRLSKEMQDELGTDKYFTREYVDTTLPKGDPSAMAQLHVAYYTGTTDTVPHVPDRCMLAGGAEYRDKRVVDMQVSIPGTIEDPDSDNLLVPAQLTRRVRLPEDEFSGTLFTYAFEQPNGESKEHNIVYFFLANGKMLSTAQHVRVQGFDVRDRYGYYFKVEVRWPGIADQAEAIKRTEAFLEAILPELLACLPDWVDVKAGRWPVPDDKVPDDKLDTEVAP